MNQYWYYDSTEVCISLVFALIQYHFSTPGSYVEYDMLIEISYMSDFSSAISQTSLVLFIMKCCGYTKWENMGEKMGMCTGVCPGTEHKILILLTDSNFLLKSVFVSYMLWNNRVKYYTAYWAKSWVWTAGALMCHARISTAGLIACPLLCLLEGTVALFLIFSTSI